MLEEIYNDLEIWQILFGLIGIIVGGFLRGFLGFGAALLIVPVLSMILNPIEAIAILLLIELPNVIYLMPSALREFDSKSIASMVLGMSFAIPLGAYALISFDSGLMKLVIAVIVLLMVGLLASGWRLKGKISWLIMFFTGIVGGFIQGAAGAGGPPFITVLLSRSDNPQKTRANIVMTLNCVSIIAAISLFSYGAFTLQLLFVSLSAAPFYILSTAIGARYFRVSGNEHFRKAALVILACIAMLLIYSNS